MDDKLNTALSVLSVGVDNDPATAFLSTQQTKPGRDAQRSSLKTIADLIGFADYRAVPWHELRYEHLLDIRAKLLETHNYRTVNKMMVALRGVLKQCWKAGKMSAEDYQRAASVGTLKGESLPAGKARNEDEISRLVEACPDDIKGIRDRALLAVMYVCGLRRAEVIALDLEDYNPDDGALKVHGKGNVQRLVYVADPAAREYLDAWLGLRRKSAAADELLEKKTGIRRGIYADSGPLFLKTNGHRALYPGRLAPSTVIFMVSSRGKAAGLDDLTCHDLRRSYATNLLDAGADVLTVSRLMGHKSVDTTSIYDRRPEQAKKAASSLVHIRRKDRDDRLR